MPWLTLYSWWDSLWDMVRVHWIWYSHNYFCIYLYLKKKYSLVQLINYQLFDLLISFEFESHILETNSHFAPELLICALGDITMHNLNNTAQLLEWVCPTLFGKYKNLLYIYFFLSWVQGLLVLGYCPSPHVILWVLHVAPAFQELAKQTIVSFIGCSQGIQLKDLWSTVLPAFHISWMDLYNEFYDGWLQTAHNWGLAIILLDQQMYQNCLATKL
jgi:hypothetical protein